jgi:8-oxo-dGTP pyrophosphatase MutT (NUDIX family)
MNEILAGGGLVYRISKKGHIKVLLIKRKGVWDLPKGKLDAGESIEQCAAREVMEEVGLLKLPMIVRPLDQSLHTYIEKGDKVKKVTYWYLMYTDERVFIPQAEEQIEAVKWKKIDDAFSMVQYDNLRSVIDRFRRLNSKP